MIKVLIKQPNKIIIPNLETFLDRGMIFSILLCTIHARTSCNTVPINVRIL